MTDPRKTEAKSNVATIKFKGLALTFPVEYEDYPLSYIEAAERGAGLAIQTRTLLGDEQWEKIRGKIPTGRELKELEAAITAAMGTDTGEEPPSSD